MLSSLAKTCNDVDHASREACLHEELAQEESGDWRLLGRFEDHCAASCQRRSHFPGHHEKRVVPRDDLSYHADGLLLGVPEERNAHGQSAPFYLVSLTGKVTVNVCRVSYVFIRGHMQRFTAI